MRAVVLSSREVPSSESLLAGFELLLQEAAPSRSAGWWDVRLWVISLGLGNGLHISSQWLGSSDCRRLACGSSSLALVFPPEAVVLLEVTVTLFCSSSHLSKSHPSVGGGGGGSPGPLGPGGFWAE